MYWFQNIDPSYLHLIKAHPGKSITLIYFFVADLPSYKLCDRYCHRVTRYVTLQRRKLFR